MDEITGSIEYKGRLAANMTVSCRQIPDGVFPGRFCQSFAQSIITNFKKNFYSSAVRQIKAFGEKYEPISMQASYQVMANTEKLISFFCDIYLDLGAEGNYMERYAFTFLKKSRKRLLLDNLFKSAYKKRMLDGLKEQIQTFQKEIGTPCTRGWERKAAFNIEKNHYYLTDDGIAVYFPQGSIAPAVWGIPTFMIEYKKLNDILNKSLL